MVLPVMVLTLLQKCFVFLQVVPCSFVKINMENWKKSSCVQQSSRQKETVQLNIWNWRLLQLN